MAQIGFVEHQITAHVPDLAQPQNRIDVPLSIRVDPLLGHTARIVTGTKLTPTRRTDLEPITAARAFCPFCADTIEEATGTFPEQITSQGRIRRGQAVIVPNVMAYSEFSAVGLYDTEQHFLDLPELTPGRVSDLLHAFVDYTDAVQRIRPMWSSINANYLPPSGSSLIHPHGQSAHDDVGTTAQRAIVEHSAAWEGNYWQQLIAQERHGPRWVGDLGRVAFLTPFAPVGFHEVWAIVQGCTDIAALTEDDCSDLGEGLSRVFGAYYDHNLASFNWAMYGAGPQPTEQYWVLLRVVSRSNPDPVYRSDVTYFEKLHQEALIDLSPEEFAGALREYFAGSRT